jgi:hypothetical protein
VPLVVPVMAVLVALTETQVATAHTAVVVAAGVQQVATPVVQVAQLSLVQLLQHTLTTAQFMDQ